MPKSSKPKKLILDRPKYVINMIGNEQNKSEKFGTKLSPNNK